MPIVLATLLKKDICLKEYGNNKIFEKGQMPIFKTHKIPAQAQLYYIHALCKLWGAQASSLQKKKPRLEFDGDAAKQLQRCQSVVGRRNSHSN